MMAVQLWLSSQSQLPGVVPAFAGSDKLVHAAWFFLLGLLLARALRLGLGWSRRRTALAVVLGAILWGASDEFHQSFVPGRDVEAADLLADVTGASIAALVSERFLAGLRLLPGRA